MSDTTTNQARQKAADAAGTAREEARDVAGRGRETAMSAAREFGDRVADEARGQERNATRTVRRWADDLAAMAEHAPQDSPARGLVDRAADTGRRAADYVDENGMSGAADELRRFAARRPAAFLGGVALAGFALGRLARAGKAQAGSDGSGAAGPDGGPDTGPRP
ncbi:hypothetical protein [Streptomyces sp. RFCAC02]|uniref:hypothetical protein n=1 Tax=Streptomyces sp. RFCAC02 TaxID=2499143 RepID=UPI00143DC5AF|nr:hypothetical protein [Streptomyces sp. RFCAC02]